MEIFNVSIIRTIYYIGVEDVLGGWQLDIGIWKKAVYAKRDWNR